MRKTAQKTAAKKTNGKAVRKTAGKKQLSAKTRTKPSAKSAAKKAAPKTKGKAPRKTTAPTQTSKQTRKQTSVTRSHDTPKNGGSNVIWRFLEMKEARRRQQAEQTAQSPHRAEAEQKVAARQLSFSRFAGPRRRPG